MVKIDADDVVQTLVGALLPRFTEAPKGLYMRVRCGLTNDKASVEEDGRLSVRDNSQKAAWVDPAETGFYVHFVFLRPDNYTEVYVSVTDRFSPPEDLSEWKLRSHHDSCWRTDGLQPITEAFFAYAEKILMEDQAPNSLRQHSIVEGLQFVEAVSERGPEQHGPSRRHLTRLKRGGDRLSTP